MICPLCQAEYRQGFTRCADCDLELVDSLPVTDEFDEATSHRTLSSADQPSEKVWSGGDSKELRIDLCAIAER